MSRENHDVTDEAQRAAHWRTNLVLTGALLLVWLTLILGAAIFARELNRHDFMGIPLAFYVFAQGAPILFLISIGFHTYIMNRLDGRFAERSLQKQA